MVRVSLSAVLLLLSAQLNGAQHLQGSAKNVFEAPLQILHPHMLGAVPLPGTDIPEADRAKFEPYPGNVEEIRHYSYCMKGPENDETKVDTQTFTEERPWSIHCLPFKDRYKYDNKTFFRKFLLSMPKDVKERVSSGRPLDLLFAFHGLGDQCYNFCYLMNKVFDLAGEHLAAQGIEKPVIVCPCGMSDAIAWMMPQRGWQSGQCCGGGHKSDMKFVDHIIPRVSDLLTDYVHGEASHASEKQVKFAHFYSWGFSNGGMFSHTLACHRPYIFDSVASLGGTNAQNDCPFKNVGGEYFYRDERHKRGDKLGVSVLDIHNLEDGFVSFDKSKPSMAWARSIRSATTSMEEWALRGHCHRDATRVSLSTIPDHCMSSSVWDKCNAKLDNEAPSLASSIMRRLFGTSAGGGGSVAPHTQMELLKCHGGHLEGDLLQSLVYTLQFFKRTTDRVSVSTLKQLQPETVKCREKHTASELLKDRKLCQDKN